METLPGAKLLDIVSDAELEAELVLIEDAEISPAGLMDTEEESVLLCSYVAE